VEQLRILGEAVLDFLFPPRCVECSRLGAWLCSSCAEAVETIRPPVCPRCGLPIEPVPAAGHPATACPSCLEQDSPLAGIRAYAWHRNGIRTAIHRLKYDDLRALAGPLGEWMYQGWQYLQPPAHAIDAVVPVPLHASRLRERGYNQAALLSRELARRLGLPMVGSALVRSRATRPQVGLNPRERQENVHDAFSCMDGRLQGRQVLLIDDVYTTGATLAAASAALHRGGAAAVWAYTLARAGERAVSGWRQD